jgi:hypothetical protein
MGGFGLLMAIVLTCCRRWGGWMLALQIRRMELHIITAVAAVLDTKAYRKKYARRQYGNNLFDRYPPGGADVIRLCDTVDALTAIVRDCQRRMCAEDQNEIERKLWGI